MDKERTGKSQRAISDMFSIVTAFLLAFARATGETMAVMMVIGNSPLFPHLLTKAQTVPALIALEIGMSEVGSRHYSALFASAFVLLIAVLIINIIFFILNGITMMQDILSSYATL